MNETTLLQFPCEFPVKVLGRNTLEFEKAVLMIMRTHFPRIKENSLRYANSKNSKYVSITVTVPAESQAQLDTLYRALVACEEVILSL